ncbi:J domain-containing protein [Sediminibacterium ginsengisoli]|uniref:DnaJ domain-containing protein n=1 Tax=Sediminibacterium ginsengisoli TaxID=413434 RepID=A0A1T4M7F7_9BACT|nr:DnaJ domain-containing protein [Sediminibacterium ginsengisoli]SJZ62728.1 DnaJ domain-containing protein [Sediminibacterium ginsengisoli]
MDFRKEYYKILGVEKNATSAEIRLAYRKLAVRYHPDRNPGKPEYEEILKEINEAKEVLLNDEKRFAYDEYWRNIEADNKTSKKPAQESTSKTTVRTRKVYREIRIYITGTIFIKYRAPQDTERSDPSLRESFYLIHATQASATVDKKDCIWSEQHPESFGGIFQRYPAFPLSIPQPLTILFRDGVLNTYYSLSIQELRIPDPQIIWVTKHENQSFGTITGRFYGYVNDFEEQEISETVTEETPDMSFEFSGPTGKTEQKTEGSYSFVREEYYHSDGRPYWGKWYRQRDVGGFTFGGRRRVPTGGCLGSTGGGFAGVLLLVLMLLKAPYLLPLLLFFVILMLLGRLAGVNKGNFTSVLIVCVFVIYIVVLISLLSGERSTRRSVATTRTESQPRQSPPVLETVRDSSDQADTLVTFYREWTDCAGNTYAGNYSYRRSELRSARAFKQQLPAGNATPAGYDEVIHALKENDASYMTGVYRLFDSLKQAKNLSSTSFAAMVMGFVQDMPYSVVLSEACDAALYNDEFITHYLKSAGAICAPYQRFGIYTPLEFIASGNGDCDSRTLFSYLVLSHYGYEVALLSSESYRHSLIGMQLPYSGQAFRYENKRYVLWETTMRGAQPGQVDPQISNMQAWRISMLNQTFTN